MGRAKSFNITKYELSPLFCHRDSQPRGEGNKVSDKPHRKRRSSEGIASPNILKLLGHLRWGSVQFFRDILLFVGLHGVELFTEISINHILNREVVGTEAEVVSPTERGVLGPEVHFHMLEEVMVLMGCEWDKDANAS